jgi:hypothetical protein
MFSALRGNYGFDNPSRLAAVAAPSRLGLAKPFSDFIVIGFGLAGRLS